MVLIGGGWVSFLKCICKLIIFFWGGGGLTYLYKYLKIFPRYNNYLISIFLENKLTTEFFKISFRCISTKFHYISLFSLFLLINRLLQFYVSSLFYKSYTRRYFYPVKTTDLILDLYHVIFLFSLTVGSSL